MEPLRPYDPQEIGSYRLVGRLGAGGMGQVFLGRSMGGRPVVVKVIAPGISSDEGFRRRFAMEVDAARRVGGFFTAQIVDADPEAEPPWLVAAYVPGPSLQEAVAAYGPLPVPTVRALGAGLAEGLAAIHACDLVHRDLKPGNVILSDDGPRVIDFGIARTTGVSTMTAVGSVLGTPGFMSPEQARGDSYIGPPSDVFSLGSVLAFAATGDGPYGTGSAPAVIYKIMSQEPDLSRVPNELRGVIQACQAKDPAARPTVRELQRHFADVASSTTHWLPAQLSAMVAERSSWPAGNTTPGTPTPPPTQSYTQVPNYSQTPGFAQPPTLPSYAPQQQQHFPPPSPPASKRGPLLAAIIGGVALVVIGIAALGIFFANRGGSSPAPTSSQSPIPNQNAVTAISGLWKGSYVCAQGPTSLQLTITPAAGSPNGVQATFNFFATANNAVPTGSYVMRGTFSSGVLTLDGDHWVVQPPNYVMVGLSAHVPEANPTTISGDVTDSQGSCTTFTLQRDNS